MDSKDKALLLAKVNEQCERYTDMVENMKEFIVKADYKLGETERNLFSVACKNVVGARRSSWRTLSSLEERAKSEQSDREKLIADYRSKVEKELLDLCVDILEEVKKLIKKAEDSSDHESKVFYYKMKADYYRYISEFSKIIPDSTDSPSDLAGEAYKAASDVSTKNLPKTDPIRLGLALNYSVFLYEIKSDSKTACQVAKEAFDDAITELDQLKEDQYKDSTLIMQLLRDNLTLWSSSDSGQEQEEQD